MMNPIEEATEAASTTCRRAMALNNLGVSIMEQGAFHHAIRIFKDSFAVMSSKHCIPSGGAFGEQAHFHIAQQANKNMPVHNLEICPCDDDDMSFQTSALPYICKFVPICLRSRDFYDQQAGSSHEKANLALAIILYNQGLVHLLAHLQDKRYTSSMGCGSPTLHGRKLLHGAVVALKCSQVMIDCHLDDIDNDEKNGGHRQTFEKLGGLVVSAMTLKTMMWTSRLLDNQDLEAAAQVGAMFSDVLADIDHYHDQLRQVNVNMCQNTASSAA